jgi:hypothetical protein
MTSDDFYIVLSLVIGGVGVIAYFVMEIRDRNQQASLSQSAVLHQKKFALHGEQNQELSIEDISSLRVYKVIVLSVVGCLGLIVVGILSIMSVGQTVKLIAIGSALMILLLILLAINKSMNRTFVNTKKNHCQGSGYK